MPSGPTVLGISLLLGLARPCHGHGHGRTLPALPTWWPAAETRGPAPAPATSGGSVARLSTGPPRPASAAAAALGKVADTCGSCPSPSRGVAPALGGRGIGLMVAAAVGAALARVLSRLRTGAAVGAAQPMAMVAAAGDGLTYVDAAHAQRIDAELMGPGAFSIDQLMELVGLSVACVVQKEYLPGPVVVVCGPGNNGGDGLVAARHLQLFGYKVTIVYPKPTTNPLYLRLLQQCRDLDIPILTELPPLRGALDACAVVDAIFGFSFSGDVRPPFDAILRALAATPCSVVSIDIPSGWPVDGPAPPAGLRPAVLVSLTAPKLCARAHQGIHYVGGRFVAPAFAERHGLVLPKYPKSDQCVRVGP